MGGWLVFWGRLKMEARRSVINHRSLSATGSWMLTHGRERRSAGKDAGRFAVGRVEDLTGVEEADAGPWRRLYYLSTYRRVGDGILVECKQCLLSLDDGGHGHGR